MKKELKDYLHLYLGCTVMNTFEPDGMSYKEKFKLNLIDESVLILARDGFIKPILRPLSDMTEKEENEVAKLCLGDDDFIITYRGMGYNEYTHFIDESVKCCKIETFCELSGINNWIPEALLQVDYKDKNHPIIIGRFTDLGKELSDDLIEEPFELTRYLLKHGFDLFGLIESGLAIDATEVCGSEAGTERSNTDQSGN